MTALGWLGRSFQHDPAPAPGTEAVEHAFRERRSGVVVEVTGRVARTLEDDTRGLRHQRFLVALDAGQRGMGGPGGPTVLVAHNLDLAPRVPLRAGDEVTVHGEYEWNAQGGVIHWTHRDPSGRHPGGWIRLDGKTYR